MLLLAAIVLLVAGACQSNSSAANKATESNTASTDADKTVVPEAVKTPDADIQAIAVEEIEKGASICDLRGSQLSQEAFDAAFQRGFNEQDFDCYTLDSESSYWKPEYLVQLVPKRWFAPSNVPEKMWTDALVRQSLTTDGENFNYLPEAFQTKENFQFAAEHGLWSLGEVPKELLSAKAMVSVFAFYERNTGKDFEENAKSLRSVSRYWLMSNDADSVEDIIAVVDENVTYAAVKFDADLLCQAQPRFKSSRVVLAAVEKNSSDLLDCVPDKYKLSIR